ncbi:MAG: hypothetical protein AAGG07_10195 [Planctomycetota bacterium]
MGASFEEKSVWVQLIAIVIGLGAYFVLAGMQLASGAYEIGSYVGLFIAGVVALVALMIAGHILAAVREQPENADERDRQIRWRASHGSGWVLGLGVIGAMATILLGLERVWTLNLLLLALALSECAALALKLFYYRRGF